MRTLVQNSEELVGFVGGGEAHELLAEDEDVVAAGVGVAPLAVRVEGHGGAVLLGEHPLRLAPARVLVTEQRPRHVV